MPWPNQRRGKPHILLEEIEKLRSDPAYSKFYFPTVEFCRHLVNLKHPKAITREFAIECLTAYQRHREECSQ